MDVDGIIGDFSMRFRVVAARDPRLLEESYRIRYDVYARELGWEPRAEAAAAEARETDPFDARSSACLLHHLPSARFIGCVRLIRADAADPDAPFPYELALTSHPGLEANFPPGFERRETGEISRMAVIAAFRRRTREHDQPMTDLAPAAPDSLPESRRFAHITLGLYLGAARMALDAGLSSVIATMEPRLARRLRSYGIRFEQCSEPFEHRGLRAIYVLPRQGFFEHASPVVQRLIGEIGRQLQTPL